jgi:hypothetical protein
MAATLWQRAGLRIGKPATADIRREMAGRYAFGGWRDCRRDPTDPALRYLRPSMCDPPERGGRGPGGDLKHQFGAWVLQA